MKNIIYLILFTLSVNLSAQNTPDLTLTTGYLFISQLDDTSWIKRHEADIRRYESENRKMTDLSCDVLFIGSSSIVGWKTINEDLAPLKIINRSYGGSTIRDILYNYNTVARGYKPKQVVLYVENDLTGWQGHRALSAGDAYDLFRLFAQMIHRDYPDAELFFVSVKASPSRIKDAEEQKILNHLLKSYADSTPKTGYIDVASAMYDKKGNIRSELFTEDRLHLNSEGYEIWKQIIRPVLVR